MEADHRDARVIDERHERRAEGVRVRRVCGEIEAGEMAARRGRLDRSAKRRTTRRDGSVVVVA